MTDRELLELAAKAAGHTLVWGGPDKDMARLEDTFDNWNPLTDDGDALRLSVKLSIWIGQHEDGVTASDTYSRFKGTIEDAYGSDPYAATRRAIVRAAAAIGKEMP